MSEIRDPLKAIMNGLNVPVEAVKPTELDTAAIAHFLAVRYANPTLKDALITAEVPETE